MTGGPTYILGIIPPTVEVFMYVFLCVLLWQSSVEKISISISEPVLSDRATVAQDGSLFVFGDRIIYKYDPAGNLIHSFGRSGQGPGEFSGACQLGIWKGELYALDRTHMRCAYFSLDGTFLRQYRGTHPSGVMYKTRQGWLGLDYLPRSGLPAKVVLYPEDLSRPKVLYEWRPEKTHVAKTWDRKSSKLPYTPVWEAPHLRVSADGTSALLVPTGTRFHAVLFDLERDTRKVIKAPDIKPLPFDKAWGKAQMDALAKPGPYTYELDAPDFWPMVKAVYWDPSGAFVVVRHGTVSPPPVCFDARGRRVEVRPEPEVLHRLLGSAGGRVYLGGFDEETDAGTVWICDPADAAKVVAAHPIVYQRPNWVAL